VCADVGRKTKIKGEKMSKFKMFLCRIFGHNFEYYLMHMDIHKEIRCCKRCHIAQEYRWHLYGYIWSTLIWRKKKAAKEYFSGMSGCEVL